MKRTLLSLTLLALLTAPVAAQQGSIFLSFDPEVEVTNMNVPTLELFDFYLVVDLPAEGGAAGGLLAYETAVHLDEGILFSSMIFNPESSLNVGGGFANGSLDLIVGTGSCLVPGVSAVVSFQGLLLEETDGLFISLGATDPSSFASVGPGWASCDGRTLTLFDDWDQSQLKVFSAPLATRDSSWGAVKALY